MASKVIEHLAAEGIHESNVAIERGDEVSRLVLRRDDGRYWVCEMNTGSTEAEEVSGGNAYVRCSPHEIRPCEGRMYGRDRPLSQT